VARSARCWDAVLKLAEAREHLEAGRLAEAEAICREILHAQPAQAVALHLLGRAHLRRGRPDLAASLIGKAVAVDPGVARFHADLGHALRAEGRVDEALASYRRSLALGPDPGVRLDLATLLPIVPRSGAELLAWRERLEGEVGRLLAAGDVVLEDPLAQVSATSFYLAYHGRSDRRLQEKLARLYLSACPTLAWTAPHCRPGVAAPAPDRRYRVGFVSGLLRDHTVGKVTRGLIEKLSRDRFEVTVLQWGQRDEWATRIARSADRAVRLRGSLASLRETIAGEALDLLFYPDVGMNPTSYFLAFARLAPVQCVTWGHPVTTGIPTLDYYLSSVDLEPSGSEDEYTERLVRLAHLPTYYYRPSVELHGQERERFGFDGSHRLYACPQLIFKIHPDFDPILADLLRRDPRGVVILVEGIPGVESQRMALLRERLARVAPDVVDRIVFLPFLDGADFLRLLAAADVLLDPPYFGGGNTSYEAFAAGAPIVTWPGPFARGRTTMACYKRMGIMDCVVDRLDGYAGTAVRLANDRAWREHVRARILARNHVLYEDIEAVREIERFFERAIAEALAPGSGTRHPEPDAWRGRGLHS
jgi:protein O-GlcNAc transferase